MEDRLHESGLGPSISICQTFLNFVQSVTRRNLSCVHPKFLTEPMQMGIGLRGNGRQQREQHRAPARKDISHAGVFDQNAISVPFFESTFLKIRESASVCTISVDLLLFASIAVISCI
jgi:hypothetical protein